MKINIIVAYSENRVIGNAGSLPWKLPEDMRHFKETTGNDPVVMGRKTFDSLPDNFRPLPGRQNIVLSKTKTTDLLYFNPKHPELYANSFDRAIELCKLTTPGQTVWVIGGGEIYKDCIPFVDEIWASEVKGIYDGDTYFPELGNEWCGEVVKSFEKFNVLRYVKKC